MKQKLFLASLICLHALSDSIIQANPDAGPNEDDIAIAQMLVALRKIRTASQSQPMSTESKSYASPTPAENKEKQSFWQSIKTGFSELSPDVKGMLFAITVTVVAGIISYHYQKEDKIRENTLWDVFTPNQISESFESVAGAHEAKQALAEIVNYLKNPAEASRLGAKVPKGVLLTGNPGTGKTLLARAVAGEADCTFISVSGSVFVQMYVGLGAARLRALFEEAALYAPCIIFIDEIDAVGSKRGTDNGSGGIQEHNHAVNQLLACMDGFSSKHAANPIIVIGATNHESSLDPALLRPGRFDRIVHVPLPGTKDRADILKIHLSKVIFAQDINLETIAKLTPGFSGADLQQIVNQAALIATNKGLAAVGMQELYEAVDLIMLGAPAKHITMSDYEKRTTAYHEAGHALMHILIPEFSGSLHGVTIQPRNNALGLTYGLPEDNKYNLNKEEMLAHICMLLAGRAAEEFMFGEISTGAHNDFERASATAHNMICRYGMTDSLGKRIYEGQHVSEKVLQQIDAEIFKILDEQYARVIKLLKSNKHLLVTLAEELLKKETLYAPEIYQLLNIPMP